MGNFEKIKKESKELQSGDKIKFEYNNQEIEGTFKSLGQDGKIAYVETDKGVSVECDPEKIKLLFRAGKIENPRFKPGEIKN